jgi:hypothetical protein
VAKACRTLLVLAKGKKPLSKLGRLHLVAFIHDGMHQAFNLLPSFPPADDPLVVTA